MKQKLTRELLEDLYSKQKLSIKDIHKLTKNSNNTIRRKIEEYQLEKELTIEDRIKQKGEIILNKAELEKLYQIEKNSIETIADMYKCSKNKIKNLLVLYGISIRETQERFNIIHEKSKQTLLQKYGIKYPYQITSVRNKMIEKVQFAYSTGKPQEKLRANWKNSNVLDKIIQSKKLNGTTNYSKPEEDAYQMLIEEFGSDDIIRQHKTSNYPYPCDFYIKSLDLYIEYQGSWVHGNTPFDSSNEIHQKLLEKWKSKQTEYFDYAIKIWSQRDPEKRKIAKENNLNWKEFFNLEELQEWLLQKKN